MVKKKQQSDIENVVRNVDVLLLKIFEQIESIDKLRTQLVSMLHARTDKFDNYVTEKLQDRILMVKKILERIKEETCKKKLDEEKIYDLRHELELSIQIILGYCDILSDRLVQDDGIAIRPFVGSLATVMEKILYGHLYKLFLPILQPRKMDQNLQDKYTEEPKPLVLIVEDNIPSRELLEIYLENDPIQIVSTADGVEAYALIKRLSFALVLLDLVLPGMTGYEILKYVKVEDQRHELPIIMISAVGEFEKIIKCIELGAEEFLPKPFNPTLLRARVNACLEKKILRDRQKRYMQEISQHRDLLKTTIDYVNNGIVVFGANGNILMCNSRFKEMYQLNEKNDIEDKPYRQWLNELLASNFFQSSTEKPEKWVEERMIAHQSVRHTWNFTEQLTDGRWFEIIEKKLPNGGIVSVHKDITGEKLGKDRLTYIAYHDSLTGLANRRYLNDVLGPFFTQGEVKYLGVLYLDMDGFKEINDRFGHDVGDSFLQEISKRIESALRQEDEAVRLGGDEFCVVVKSVKNTEELQAIAKRLLEKIHEPFKHDGEVVEFSASIGIAAAPENGNKLEDVLQAADKAMFEAKGKGKATFCVAK